jgi:hypothetical protein
VGRLDDAERVHAENVQAKAAPTRAKRIDETARLAAQGERANQWRPKVPRQ